MKLDPEPTEFEIMEALHFATKMADAQDCDDEERLILEVVAFWRRAINFERDQRAGDAK